MRTYLLLILFYLVNGALSAQILHPANWKVSAIPESVTAGDTLAIHFDVSIDRDWYLYSNDFDPDLGPIVTEFSFVPAKNFQLIGDVKAIDPKKKYDKIWEGEYTYFKSKGKFIQKVLITGPVQQISGSYFYQTCSEINGQCINFDEEFTARVNYQQPETQVSQAKPAAAVEEKDDPVDPEDRDLLKDAVEVPSSAKDSSSNSRILEKASDSTLQVDEENLDMEAESLPVKQDESMVAFFFVAFLTGLAALLTPCVFPMIPMTVTFFTNSGSNRAKGITKAVVYGLSIIVIYTLSGTLVAVLVGPEFANWLATHWLPNLLFFAIFIFFALSFLGLFEITLPSWLVNSADKQADKGGYYGVFFMAFTLVLVSFSCTGPLVGSILVESARGEFGKPIVGMLGFSAAFAIPFTLFAVFPEGLKAMPRSGSWLNSVKVVLGFLELALALKFLSVADQVYHWGLLDRGVFLSIWIVVFFLLGLYLLGKLRLPGDSEMQTTPVLRLILAIITFSFVVYLIPGLFGAPLKALAGYLPPATSQDFNLMNRSAASTDKQAFCGGQPRHAEMLEIPYGIQGYFDYQEALECARSLNKPLFIDFTGHGCVNCREMEARVWSDPAVLKRLKEDYVVVALYIDDKMQLPEEDWVKSAYDGKMKKTIGKINADFQITRYNNNAQPFYVLLDNEEELLLEPKAYDLTISSFIDYLDKGLTEFNQ